MLDPDLTVLVAGLMAGVAAQVDDPDHLYARLAVPYTPAF